MRLTMSDAKGHQFPGGGWRTALVGPVLDDRGREAVEYVTRQSDRVLQLTYDPSTLEVCLAGVSGPAEGLAATLKGSGPFMIETTTMGFVEVFLACRAFRELGEAGIDLLYVEPESYRTPQRVRTNVLHRRDFELSDEVEDFSGIPGAAFMLGSGRPTKAVFMLGYEGSRLEQVLDQTAIPSSDCTVVFGVPAFNPGWEMHSFANNVRILQERRITSVLYAAAQSPLAAYDCLSRVLRSCGHARMLVGPIGTKPHGIGCALFAAEHSGIGVVYDHPTRSVQRSERTGVWHMFHASYREET